MKAKRKSKPEPVAVFDDGPKAAEPAVIMIDPEEERVFDPEEEWATRDAARRVIVEPQLEENVGDLNADQRLNVARKLERWAHQLRVSAVIMEADAIPNSVDPCSEIIAPSARLSN